MEDGRVKSHGSLSETIATDAELAHVVEEQMEATDMEKAAEDELYEGTAAPLEPGDVAASKGKLVAKEEINEGHVGFEACKRHCLFGRENN
jgi:hypothetical protein